MSEKHETTRMLRPLKSWFTVSFWKAMLRWLFIKPKYVVLYFIGVGLVYFIAALLTSEPMRISGFSLNIIGIITTFYGVFTARKKLNLPGFMADITSWLVQIPILRKHVRVSSTAATARSVAEVCARAYSRVPPDASLEDRIKALEKNMEFQDKYIQGTKERLSKNIKEMKKEMNSKIDNIQNDIKDINNKLMQVTVGDIGFQILGLAWIVTAQAQQGYFLLF